MKQFLFISSLLSLCLTGFCYGDDNYCEYNNCGSQADSERIYFHDRYQPVYYDSCCPYYHKQYGVSRSPHWPGKIYEPFRQQLTR